MAYQDLTPEQQASVQALSQVLRPLAGEFARLLAKFEVATSYYVGNVETMIAGLDASDPIPNTSGLAGAQDLTKEQFVNLMGYLIVSSATPDGSSGSFNTNYHRALYAQACGPENLLGG